MKTFNKSWYFLLVLGTACFGAIVMGIESATGYLAWYTDSRAQYFSPPAIAAIAFVGGIFCVLRLLLEFERSVSKPVGAAFCLVGGAVLSAIVYSARVYGFSQWVGHLPPLQAAMAGFVMLGSIGFIACAFVALGMKKR